jgi:ABC-2 type transport system permease protein
MAIYKHNYSGYSGRLTSRWSRCLILTRYNWARLFHSKFLVLFMALCLCYPILGVVFIYLSHNEPFQRMIGFRAFPLLTIDGFFFYTFCVMQGAMAYLLTALLGPTLVSPDLANGALPLYLCRPFSRAEYIIGKMGVLLAALALITWIPGLALFGLQSLLAGWGWLTANLWLAWGIFFGLFIWTVVLSLIALALSAWVKWKIAAGALVLAVFFAGAGFGNAIDSVMRTSYGSLINLSRVIHAIWAELFRYDARIDMMQSDAWLVLGVTCTICLLLLAKRIRAFEVIK